MVFIYFVIVLSITIMIHEFGHFLLAKKNNVYVYEFCLGMGPKIFSKKKDETEYSIRLFPIGGFVSMAGEDLEQDSKIKSDRQLCNKSWLVRFLTLIAGILFNFFLAILLIFIIALINGVPNNKNIIGYIDSSYPISNTNIKVGDKIKKINNIKVNSYEMLSLEMAVRNGENITFTVLHENGKTEDIKVSPLYDEKKDIYTYGISIDNSKQKGFFKSIFYSFRQTINLSRQMLKTLFYLITGKLSIDNLSGPIGIYSIVGSAAASGFLSILYLIAYLCINVAIINLIPFPAFDGGRILFLLIEKIKGSKVNPKIENVIHSVGFILLMIFMIYISYHDILRNFK